MDVELKPVGKDEREVLANLLEKYDYEFSQWDQRDVNKLGLYGYDYLDYYWTEKNRWPFFVLADGKLAGFVMVNDFPEVNEPTDYCLSEFFIMLKYRRHGLGMQVAGMVLDRFHGRWQLKRHPKNLASAAFWDKVVARYAKAGYRLVEGYPGSEYDDGTPGDVYFFET